MRDRISMVLVDDTPRVDGGVAALIRAQADFHVLVEMADVAEALRQVRAAGPDIVLLNLRQNGDDVLALAGALHGGAPKSRVILMGLQAPHKDVASLVRAGVSGFIMAGASLQRFRATIRAVAGGDSVLPVELAGSLLGQLRRHGVQEVPRRRLDFRRLTGREREVANLIALGLSTRRIATRLEIALHAARRHVGSVFSKLTINNRLDLASLSDSGLDSARAPIPALPPDFVMV